MFAHETHQTDVYVIYRVLCGSKICKINMSKLMFARNHDLEFYRVKSPNEIICGIIDVATNKFYDIDLKSLFHLGAYDINLFSEDFKNE
jgi:hypothetical protein